MPLTLSPPHSLTRPALRVRWCVLLAGGVRPSPLAAAAGCNVLDLHLSAERTVLGAWLDTLAGLEIEQLVLSHAAQARAPRGSTSARPDLQAFRGPAGAVRDVCEPIKPDDLVLVIEAASALREGLDGLAAGDADATLAVNPDGSPAGVYLLRARMLDLVPRRGFVDLKEQWLGKAIASGAHVRCWGLPRGVARLRTRADLLGAALGGDASVVAPGAEVHPGAAVVASLVMPGARVEPGAAVVRSVLCPGAVVPAGAEVVDAIVSSAGVVPDRSLPSIARRTWLGDPA